MLTRRKLLVLAGTAAVLTGLGLPAQAQAPDSPAAAFVQRTGEELIRALSQSPSPEARSQQLLQVIDRTVDVDGLARFCLGIYWRRATPQQQQEYIAAFHQSLAHSITGRMGEYEGVRFAVGRSAPEGPDTAVQTTILRQNNPPLQVVWLVSTGSGTPKIIDVQAEGTSMRLTERSDYTSFLQQHGGNVQALIDALKRQAVQQG
ncbi:MAG: ABC transporter substrate-binding protein [Acidisphaera sp.]|nr:ABC transporter substrate-binding protein [Acidisphaera sp.]